MATAFEASVLRQTVGKNRTLLFEHEHEDVRS
jgi:hypothetical protein